MAGGTPMKMSGKQLGCSFSDAFSIISGQTQLFDNFLGLCYKPTSLQGEENRMIQLVPDDLYQIVSRFQGFQHYFGVDHLYLVHIASPSV